MRKLIIILFVFLGYATCFAENPSLTNVLGRWQNPNYLFIFNPGYKATVIIYANTYQSFVFSGIYTVENDTMLRINIDEIKTCLPGEAFSRKGFTKTLSSRFVFSANVQKGKNLSVKPKEIIIDGKPSEGYFESNIALQKK